MYIIVFHLKTPFTCSTKTDNASSCAANETRQLSVSESVGGGKLSIVTILKIQWNA